MQTRMMAKGPIRSVLVALALLPAVLAPAWAEPATLVFDAESGDVLLARNADTREPAAGFVRLMTAYLTIEAFESGQARPDVNLFVSADAAAQPPPGLGLSEFDTITAEQALDAVMAASANDAAAVLAEFLAGSVRDFVDAMNAKAAELGLEHTRFSNISGAADSQHYSTPRDMIVFSLALMRTYPDQVQRLVGQRFVWRGKDFQGPDNFLDLLSEASANKVSRASEIVVDGRRVIVVVWNAADAYAAEAMVRASLEDVRIAAGGATAAASEPPASEAAARGAWAVQLGAFSSVAAARSQLDAAATLVPELAAASDSIEIVARDDGALYRALYRGMPETQARAVCARLQAAGQDCFPVSP